MGILAERTARSIDVFFKIIVDKKRAGRGDD